MRWRRLDVPGREEALFTPTADGWRIAGEMYRYEALVDDAPFVARLDTDALGRVIAYEGLWIAEDAS